MEGHLCILPEGGTSSATHLPKGGHPPIHCRGTRMESIVPWQPHLHPDGWPHQGYSAKGGKRGQHDHGSEGAPVLGGIRHVWTCIRELNPKKTKSHGLYSHLCPHKLGDPSGPVDISSQVSAPDDAEMAETSLKEIPTAPSSTAKTPGPSGGTTPADPGHL